jgi:hypothetical protein
VPSWMGAEAWAGVGYVEAAPVASGWSRRRPRARARAAGRQGGAGLEVARSRLGGGGDSLRRWWRRLLDM